MCSALTHEDHHIRTIVIGHDGSDASLKASERRP